MYQCECVRERERRHNRLIGLSLLVQFVSRDEAELHILEEEPARESQLPMPTRFDSLSSHHRTNA